MESRIRENITERYERFKNSLLIIIFGSYTPKKTLERLEKLREYLISCGYTQTKLVKDYSDDIIPPTITKKVTRTYVKSIELCRLSDCNFFVATHKGRGKGWVNELTYCCRQCPDGVIKTTLFDETKKGGSASGILNLGMIDLHGMARQPFKSIITLKKAGEKVALKYTMRLLDKSNS